MPVADRPWDRAGLNERLPYRVHTPRLLLRCWEPADAPALCDAISKSLDHLRAWVPWAMQEPMPQPEKIKQILKWRARVEHGGDLIFGVFDPEDGGVLGAVGMHPRIGAGAREIGYWVRVDRTRQGIATEAAAALTRVGFEVLKLRRTEIHCDAANVASAAVPRKLGYVNQVIIKASVPNKDTGPRTTAIWSMTRSTYPASAAASIPIEAFDGLGEAILLTPAAAGATPT